ncbi:MAG: hypothetical protein K0R62_2640 [Nonomuraea muscovyensis]|jgi:hypothetical protein|uniref:Uncharacterized protein n=1 Tax=Nonomuraea muscovyensis TaxID=1124761 RepID=A0A7X0CBU4_9ACTN|nr:hypothetical protein [Nonomuraea muscovyensis]MDF2706988.1 hypothetical protein [Nonomuraea muscovyensis]
MIKHCRAVTVTTVGVAGPLRDRDLPIVPLGGAPGSLVVKVLSEARQGKGIRTGQGARER